MPPGSIIPVLAYPDLAAAVDWLCGTFGFVERLRIGGHRSQLVVGPAAAVVAVQGEGQAGASAATHSLMLRVDDLDQHYAQARAGGARIVQPPADYPYGERQYTAEDLAGHRWTFTQPIADIDPRDWGGTPRAGADAAEGPEESRRVVAAYWAAMQTNDFRAAAALLAEDYLLEWPQSGERVRGRANFIAVNEQYPAAGRWQFAIHQLVAEGDRVVSDVSVTDGALAGRAITFSTVRGGLIARQVEFWPDPFAPAGWRAAWVERD
jgi:uncharacterized glyoxalase superfamily protein PhnB/ketosteroid isomerase-like protein